MGKAFRAGPGRAAAGLLVIALASSCTPSPTGGPSTSATAPATTTTSRPVPTTTSTVPPSTTTTTPTLPEEVRPLFGYLTALTAIHPHAGWRNSAGSGEAEALDYVGGILEGFSHLRSLGMEVERQSFPVFLSTELRESRLFLTTDGREIEVAADAPRGHRYHLAQALRFDSDGAANDSQPDPVEAWGTVVVVRSEDGATGLGDADLSGSIVFVDYELVSPASVSPADGAALLTRLIDGGVAGMVLVTDSADGPQAQPGALAGDGRVLESVTTEAVPPVLEMRLEDCAAAGISGWNDLAQVERARLVWDADVSSPGTSGNLVARIPGADPSQAVIVGAHLDSPNSPGALDNGLGSAVLLDLARALDEGQAQPPLDLYLVWFGSEEIGLLGSLHFVDTHQELLDRAVGALILDGIIAATPPGYLEIDGWSYGRFGDDRLTFARYLEGLGAAQGIVIDDVIDVQGLASDNTVFSAFVPQAALAFGGPNSGYGHTPYDTWEAAAEEADYVGDLAELVRLAATETGREPLNLRVTPEPDRRALLVGSHTEASHLSGAMLVDLAYALAWEGFDVDTVPYGRTITAEDLEDVALVVVLPTIDYADDGADEAWTGEESDLIAGFVERGGLLVLANSAGRLVFGRGYGSNEDWGGLNALAERFGAAYEAGALPGSAATTVGEHPLMRGAGSLAMIAGNTVPFTMAEGLVLAEAAGQPAAGLVGYGTAGGEVLVLADIGMLQPLSMLPPEVDNLGFLRNLAAYARAH